MTDILPRRKLSMSDVVHYAADMTIVNLVSDDEWIVALFGTARCANTGIDPTGQNFMELCSAEERAFRAKAAQRMFTAPCGVRSSLIQKFEDGSQAEMVAVSLPMRGSDGAQKILSYAVLLGDIDESLNERPALSKIETASHQFLDFGHGAPCEDALMEV